MPELVSASETCTAITSRTAANSHRHDTHECALRGRPSPRRTPVPAQVTTPLWCPRLPTISAGPRGFSWTVPVTQRHVVDRHHLEANLRFSAAWTGLPEAHRSLVEVLVEAAASSACGHIMLELARDMRHLSAIRLGQKSASIQGFLARTSHYSGNAHGRLFNARRPRHDSWMAAQPPCGPLMRDNSVRAWQPLRQFFRPGEGFPLPGDSGSIGIYPGSVRSVTATCGSGRYQGQARNIS